MERTITRNTRLIAALLIGCVTAIAIAWAGFSMFRTLWPAYAAAESTKAYTLAMLLSRLTLGAFCAASAGCITTITAADNGRGAWWLGGIFLMLSLPVHLFSVWNDYPAWYHFIYLSYLVPITGLSARVYRRLASGAEQHVSTG